MISSVSDIVSSSLCIGCGACAPACPSKAIRLWDFDAEGIRPVVEDDAACAGCSSCLDVCPGMGVEFVPPQEGGQGGIETHRRWGPVLEIWEGHATDDTVRAAGASGGALTALANYCLKEGGMGGVLHTAADPADPVRNRTRISRTAEELLAATGSRYSPASVGNGFGALADESKPCAVIAKPSEIAALRKTESTFGKIAEKVGVTMSFFCAETPSTTGSVNLVEKMGVPLEELGSLRYRGNGWPGNFAPVRKGESEEAASMTYQKSWAFLQSYRPWAAHLWPDGGGELADISCGDPWYTKPDGENPGTSLVVVRTERGRALVKAAMEKGYLHLIPAETWKLDGSQENLLKKKGSVWARVVAMKLLGMDVPKYSGLSLFHCWKKLTPGDKLRSSVGTVRRVLKRGLRRGVTLDTGKAKPVPAPHI